MQALLAALCMSSRSCWLLAGCDSPHPHLCACCRVSDTSICHAALVPAAAGGIQVHCAVLDGGACHGRNTTHCTLHCVVWVWGVYAVLNGGCAHACLLCVCVSLSLARAHGCASKPLARSRPGRLHTRGPTASRYTNCTNPLRPSNSFISCAHHHHHHCKPSLPPPFAGHHRLVAQHRLPVPSCGGELWWSTQRAQCYVPCMFVRTAAKQTFLSLTPRCLLVCVTALRSTHPS